MYTMGIRLLCRRWDYTTINRTGFTKNRWLSPKVASFTKAKTLHKCLNDSMSLVLSNRQISIKLNRRRLCVTSLSLRIFKLI